MSDESATHLAISDFSTNRLRHVFNGFFLYYCTSLLVVFGALFSLDFLRPNRGSHSKPGGLTDVLANWDGEWYVRILDDGYTYELNTNSSVAFFPAFPILGRGVSRLTGLPGNGSLLFVSHACLLGCFIIMAAYASHRFATGRSIAVYWVLFGLGLWPTTFFFRMAYSESLFLLTALLAFYGMERKWPPVVLSLLVGLATATRPVGVALLPPLVLHFWSHSTDRRQLVRLAILLPLALWGLAAYMIYQWFAFDDPLAFAKTQDNWRGRPPVPLGEKAISLMTLEPIWSVFDSSSPCYWKNHGPENNPLFSLHLANPLYFMGAVGLILLGAWKRWLNAKEVILAAGLLFIPYVTRSHEMCMGAMGRFAAVVFPQYLVMGQILTRFPAPLAGFLLAFCGFFLGCYAALFAAGYRFF